MALLDFSNVISHIAYVEGGDNVTEINFVAKDKVTKASEPASLKVAIEKLALDIVNIETLEPDQTELTFDVSYNGANFDNVKFEVRNERNTWDAVKPVSIAPVSRAASVYRVVLPVAADGNVVFRVSCGSLTTEAITVSRNILGAEINENDVYARRAAVNLTDAGVVADGAQLFLSPDGVSFTPTAATVSGTTLSFDGLTPGTSYVARVEKDGVRSKKLSFTTEASTQLPNGNMEKDATINGSASNWQNYVFADGWGTNNAMTTSQGGDFAYTRISGTIPTNDAHDGKAVLVRTVGWGSGNTAMGNGGSSGKTKYTDTGLLHLGGTRTTRPDGYDNREGALTTDDLECGIEFASRPASVSFWYKYSAKNSSDKGYAEVWVKDASGNTISGNVVNLDAVGTYTQIFLPLTYAEGASKAAKIYVKFLSTYDRSFLEKSDANFSGPGFGGNWGKGTYVGSELYIDDVVLNYN